MNKSDRLRVTEDFGAGVTAVTEPNGDLIAYRVEVDGRTAWSDSATLGQVGMGGARQIMAAAAQATWAGSRAAALSCTGDRGAVVPDAERFAYQETPSSSKAARVGYCAATETWRVVFKDGATAYRYRAVPAEKWRRLMDTVLQGGSVGSFLSREIERGGFEYEREV